MSDAREGADTCDILHVDMDAFFASVEVLDDPTLAGKPVIVGGTGARGVVASCTYEARAYGVHSAMPTSEARRRCPEAVFLAGRFQRYARMSDRLHEVLHRFTPLVEPIALDEAFLDVSGAHRLFGPPPVIAQLVIRDVHAELSLDCTVGVARTKLLAKLASRAAKPRATSVGVRPGPGVVVVPPPEEQRFLHALEIRALWGIGPVTARRLTDVGVTTVEELAAMPERVLCRILGTANGRRLAALARGEDASSVEPLRTPRSIGHEETFATDLRVPSALQRHVVRMADLVADRLRDGGLRGRTVTLKVRYGDRSTITRSQTLPSPCGSARAVAAVAGALLEAVDVAPGVRLLGVTVSSLHPGDPRGRQLSFDAHTTRPAGAAGSAGLEEPGSHGSPTRADAWEDVETAVSQVRARYGRASVGPGVLLGPDGISVKRRGDAQWGPPDARRDR